MHCMTTEAKSKNSLEVLANSRQEGMMLAILFHRYGMIS